MTPVALFLVTVAGIFLIGAAGELVFRRTQIPDVVWLIATGIVLGPLTGVVTRQDLGEIAPYFAALTLVVVLFEGGSRLRLDELTRAAPRSGALAVLTFLLATLAATLLSVAAAKVGFLPESWSWTHGLLLGCIVGGSSSIIIMPAMAQAQVEPRLANLIGLESAFTDAFCVVGATALINLLSQGPEQAGAPGWALLRSFGIGLAIGGAGGAVWLFLLRALKGSDHAYPVTLSALMVLYVVIERSGGSAALGILTFAVIVGNAKAIGARAGFTGEVGMGSDVRGFHRQMTFIVKSFFFTFIGAMLGPPWGLLALGTLLGVLLYAVRIPAVWLATARSGLSKLDERLVSVAMPRGMAAGVLATLPAAAGVAGTEELPTVVFACVLASVLVFAVGFPLARRAMASATSAAAPSESVQSGPAPVPDSATESASEQVGS